MKNGRSSLHRGALIALLVAGCAAAPPYDTNRKRIETGAALLAESDFALADEKLNVLLASTQPSATDHELQRFFAAWLLAQVHARAAITQPFRTETTRAAGRIGGIGRREESLDRRPSVDGHLVGTVYHASQARALYARAARSGPKRDGKALVPDDLWNFGVDHADANLQILLATVYARLGFQGEVSKTLVRSPELLRVEPCLATLERYRVPSEVRPWVALMVFDHLRLTDEDEAFRFGVLAVEGYQRFGHPLPQAEIERVEDWILAGASVQFVCPRSQTPYLRGETRSPISGVPHLEYVPVEKR